MHAWAGCLARNAGLEHCGSCSPDSCLLRVFFLSSYGSQGTSSAGPTSKPCTSTPAEHGAPVAGWTAHEAIQPSTEHQMYSFGGNIRAFPIQLKIAP